MTTEEIRQTLERFYNAETTNEEEATLRNFFRRDDIPADLQTDKTLFDQLYAPETATPPGFGLALAQDIERWNTLEKTVRRKARTTNMRRMAGMAASVLLLSTIAICLNRRTDDAPTHSDRMHETYDNPNDAAGETERALTRFSVAINKGLSKMSNIETDQRQ